MSESKEPNEKKNELAGDLHSRIMVLSEEGDLLALDGHYPEALAKYWQAFDLLPEPRNKWEAATGLLSAIGDSNFEEGDFSAGRDALSMAMTCPGGIGNAFLHLRLGQCCFELDDFTKAADEFIRAYTASGRQLFEYEDEKYFSFLKTKAQKPAGGW